jgi:hypothetical protein
MTTRSLIGVGALLLGSIVACDGGPTEPSVFDISGDWTASSGGRYAFVCEQCPASQARFFGAVHHPVSVEQALEGEFNGRQIEITVGGNTLRGTIRSNDVIELGPVTLRRS